jgi:hypothetical protein
MPQAHPALMQLSRRRMPRQVMAGLCGAGERFDYCKAWMRSGADGAERDIEFGTHRAEAGV